MESQYSAVCFVIVACDGDNALDHIFCCLLDIPEFDGVASYWFPLESSGLRCGRRVSLAVQKRFRGLTSAERCLFLAFRALHAFHYPKGY